MSMTTLEYVSRITGQVVAFTGDRAPGVAGALDTFETADGKLFQIRDDEVELTGSLMRWSSRGHGARAGWRRDGARPTFFDHPIPIGRLERGRAEHRAPAGVTP